MEINGSTKIMGVIGNPVAHSLSPLIQNFFAQKLGNNIVYTAFDVTSQNFAAAVEGARALGITGLNVTAPHKPQAAKLAASLTPLAKQADAVNLLELTETGYVGHNTDIYGAKKALEYKGIDMSGKTVALVGAGGAARAAGVAVARLGAKKIFIINRTRAKAESLANILKMYYNIDTEICKLCDCAADVLILAATPDFIPQGLDRFGIIFDMNYHPPNRIPRAFGGPEMLVYQAALSYEIIVGAPVSTEIIDEILVKIKGRLLC